MYRVGQQVYYINASNVQKRAVIRQVHLDQHPPYYTLLLVRSRREVQTEQPRIRPRRGDALAPRPPPPATPRTKSPGSGPQKMPS